MATPAVMRIFCCAVVGFHRYIHGDCEGSFFGVDQLSALWLCFNYSPKYIIILFLTTDVLGNTHLNSLGSVREHCTQENLQQKPETLFTV